MNLNNLGRRVSTLERQYSIGADPEVLAGTALEILTDNELGLLDEYMSLLRSGFSASEIEEMMEPQSYQVVNAAIEKADREYKRLTEPLTRPKRRGKPLEVPKEHRYDECGLGVREDA